MMPSSPIRGRVRSSRPFSAALVSVLAIDVLVAVIERVDALGVELLDRPERAGQVHGLRGLLAHHRALERRAWPVADGEHAVAAHEHRAGAVRADRLDHAAPDLLVADQRERADRDRAAELV